jgi:hypothetical protein
MLLGQKSQSQVTKIVYQAAGAGGVNQARTIAAVASAHEPERNRNRWFPTGPCSCCDETAVTCWWS